MPPQLFSQNIFLPIPPRKNLEILANRSHQNLDRDQLCTILHNFATAVTSRSTIIGYIQVFLKTEPLIGRNYFATDHKFLTLPQLSLHVENIQIIEFINVIHALITDICLELLCILLYLRSWTTCWLSRSDPPNQVGQQLQEAPSIQGKRSSTSNLSYMSPLTLA